MNNHWLDNAKKKQLFSEIEELGLEIMDEDGTFGDFLNSLTDKQTDLLMQMRVRDFMAESDDLSFNFDFVVE